MTKIITICAIGFIALFGGCKSLPFLSGGNTIVTGPTPTPSQQLWKAAKSSNPLVTISILGIWAGVFAFFNGSKFGLSCIGASCVSLYATLAVARFSGWMAISFFVASLAAVGISVVVKNKAIKEIVVGVQKYKDGYSGSDSRPYLTDRLKEQTKSTRKLVQSVKNKLKLHGEI